MITLFYQESQNFKEPFNHIFVRSFGAIDKPRLAWCKYLCLLSSPSLLSLSFEPLVKWQLLVSFDNANIHFFE